MLKYSPFIILVVTLAITSIATFRLQQEIKKENYAFFSILVSEGENELHNLFAIYEQVLKGGVGLYHASNYVDHKEWRSYVDSIQIQKTSKSILALGVADKVHVEDLDRYIEKYRKKEISHFDIFPPRESDKKLIIKFIEPYEENKNLLGYDIADTPEQIQAAIHSKKTLNTSLSKNFYLRDSLHKNANDKVVLLISSIIDEKGDLIEDPYLQTNHKGWVFAIIHLQEFLQNIESVTKGQINYRIYEDNDIDPENLVYQSVPEQEWVENNSIKHEIAYVNNSQKWIIEWQPSENFKPPGSHISIFLVALIGTVLSCSFSGLFFLVYQLYGGTARNLRISEERLELAVSGSQNGLWDWDLTTNEMYFSPHFRELIGYEGDDEAAFPNKFQSFEGALHPDDKSFTLNALEKHIANQDTPYDVEYRLKQKNGEYGYFRAKGKVVRKENDKATRLAGSITDISQRKQVEQELRDMIFEAERANNAKSDFLANMSHEIRTPMNGVVGTANLMADTQLNGKQKRYLDIIQSSAQTLLEIINEILDYSKIESGKLDIHQSAFNLKDTIEKQMQLLQPLAQEKNINYILDLDKNIPEYIIGDSIRISQILTNLTGNSIKFTQEGGDISVKVRSDKDLYLVFEVTDTGIGIPEDKLDSIFGVFEQVVDKKRTTKTAGTGLGLAISKRLVEMMGGQINVESIQGKGSKFWFNLPLIVALKEDIDALKKEESKEKEAKKTKLSAHILVVEDVPTNQFVIMHMLEGMGCKVDLAENGKEAVTFVQEKDYDVILMDCQMPIMNGFEATQFIRTLKITQPPIIALTANALEGDREKCLDSGMDDFISKPISKKSVVDVLSKWINTQE